MGAAQSTVNEVTDNLRRIAGQSPDSRLDQQKVRSRTQRVIVADSNGQHLIPDLLHDEKNVVLETRYTIEDAMGNIPKCEAEVTDIVMMVGLNNIRKPSATINQTIEKYDNACKMYQARFPTAKIHVGSVAPASEKCLRFNAELQKLARSRNAPFVSAQPLLEETNFGLQPKANTMRGIHYTPRGVKLIANEIKRSLYGHNVNQDCQPNQVNQYNEWYAKPRWMNAPQAPNMNHLNDLRQILSMAVSCIAYA